MIGHDVCTWRDTQSSLCILPSVCTISHHSTKWTKPQWTAHMKVFYSKFALFPPPAHTTQAMPGRTRVCIGWRSRIQPRSVSRRAKRIQRSARPVLPVLLRRLHPPLKLSTRCVPTTSEVYLCFPSSAPGPSTMVCYNCHLGVIIQELLRLSRYLF